VIAVGNSGTGKTHIALGLGLAACQKGSSVGFTTAAAMVHELIEARDEKRLLRLQRRPAVYKLLIIDELLSSVYHGWVIIIEFVTKVVGKLALFGGPSLLQPDV
jgi:DNA replication protein DnaC